jgi:phage shock protein PspC (stress-responsive transcriptional regulator)/predicted membrane protein
MTQNTESTAYAPPPPAPRPPLRRSESDRVLAGVAGGFARWLGIDPVIVRVVLVVLAVFGGSGLLLYVIGWLFIPAEGAPSSQAEKFIDESRRPNSTARTVLIVIGIVIGVILFANLVGALFGGWGGSGSVLLLLAVGATVLYLANRRPEGQPVAASLPSAAAADGAQTAVPIDASGRPASAEPETAVLPTAYAYGGAGSYPGYVAPQPTPIPPTPKPRSYLGLATLSIAVVVTGILVSLDVTGLVDIPAVVVLSVALAILGIGLLVGAFVGRARWLVALAIPLLLVTAIVAVIPANLGSRLGSGIGERTWAPTTVADIASPYQLSVGSAELDLSGLALPAGDATIPVRASVGIGELIVTVPDDARVLVHATTDMGTVLVEGVASREGENATITTEMPGGPATGPTIDLFVSTSLGDLEVSRA